MNLTKRKPSTPGEILTLSANEREVFIRALLKPPKPSSNLLKAVRGYKKDVTSK